MNNRLSLLAVFALFVCAFLTLRAVSPEANVSIERKTTLELKRKLDESLRKIAAQEALLLKQERLIQAMEDNIKTYRQEAFYHLHIAKSMTTRHGGFKPTPILPPKATPTPPPPVYVRGEIKLVNHQDGRPTLVQISVGADQGIQTGHILDAYRLQPKAIYLGAIRIVDVLANKSVGQLEQFDDTIQRARPQLQIGDLVASDISPMLKNDK